MLPNVALFVLGQGVVAVLLRTGRTWLGSALAAWLWLAADAAAVARLVYGETGPWFLLPLVAMQAGTVVGALWLGLRWWWRRRSLPRRERRFAAALAAYLQQDLPAAERGLRGLVWDDPWDAGAWLLLGDVLRRAGRRGAARRCYRRAGGVDGRKQYRDLLRLRVAELPGS